MLPNVPIASLPVETERHTGFLDCFVHAGGKQARSSQLKSDEAARAWAVIPCHRRGGRHPRPAGGTCAAAVSRAPPSRQPVL